jgi:hypothetical protein
MAFGFNPASPANQNNHQNPVFLSNLDPTHLSSPSNPASPANPSNRKNPVFLANLD